MLTICPIDIRRLSRDYAEIHAKNLLTLGRDNDWETWTVENLMAERPAKWDLSLVAFAGTTLVGYAICSERDGGLHLHHIIIGPGFKGKGIGTHLLAGIARNALSHGLSRIRLKVHLTNQNAIRFYERLGFEPGLSENGLLWMSAAAAAVLGSATYRNRDSSLRYEDAQQPGHPG